MDMQQRICALLARLKPDLDVTRVRDFVEEGALDSFDVVLITNELEREFNISIDGELVVPENYKSVAALVTLVELTKEQGDARQA